MFTATVLYLLFNISLKCFSILKGIRSPVWQYPSVITSQAIGPSQVDTSSTGSVAPSTDTLSNGSSTPPNVSNGEQIPNSSNGSDSKFIFPPGNPIPLSPGLFGTPTFFNPSTNNLPITPTLLTPTVSFSEPYIRHGQLYSPFTLTPHTGLSGTLPRTPTLPPPSPHAIVSNSFPLTAITHQGLTANTAALVGSPFQKGGSSFLDDITKIGSISPFIVSPSLSPNRKPNSTTIFFPTTITASGEAKFAPLNGSIHERMAGTPDDASLHSTDSPLVKREVSSPQQHCYIEETT